MAVSPILQTSGIFKSPKGEVMKKIVKIVEEKLKELNIDPKECFVVGSAILYQLGILEGDCTIDIELSTNAWNDLLSLFSLLHSEVPNFVRSQECRFYKSTGPKISALVIEGIEFISIEELLRIKKVTNRPKDCFHIRKIEEYIQNNQLQASKI